MRQCHHERYCFICPLGINDILLQKEEKFILFLTTALKQLNLLFSIWYYYFLSAGEKTSIIISATSRFHCICWSRTEEKVWRTLFAPWSAKRKTFLRSWILLLTKTFPLEHVSLWRTVFGLRSYPKFAQIFPSDKIVVVEGSHQSNSNLWLLQRDSYNPKITGIWH